MTPAEASFLNVDGTDQEFIASLQSVAKPDGPGVKPVEDVWYSDFGNFEGGNNRTFRIQIANSGLRITANTSGPEPILISVQFNVLGENGFQPDGSAYVRPPMASLAWQLIPAFRQKLKDILTA